MRGGAYHRGWNAGIYNVAEDYGRLYEMSSFRSLSFLFIHGFIVVEICQLALNRLYLHFIILVVKQVCMSVFAYDYNLKILYFFEKIKVNYRFVGLLVILFLIICEVIVEIMG